MSTPQSVGVLAAFALLLLAMMWLGWRGRQRRTAPLVGALPTAPAELGEAIVANIEGIYVSTTTHGDWLDRIAAQDLGYRSSADVSVYQHGVLFERPGARDLYIPAQSIIEVTQTPGMAGKFVGGDGIIVTEWHVGAKYSDEETRLDSGFKTTRKQDRALLVNAIKEIIPSQPQVKESK